MEYKLLGLSGKHVFFGYYDLPQINADGAKALVHVANKNANPSRDAAEIGYFDLLSGSAGISIGEYHKIAATRAWCWQQGARLRWHPTEPGKLLYNDVDDDGSAYVTKEYDLTAGETRTTAPALYDISKDFKYGVHIDFERLQRLRPGYGYRKLKTSYGRTADDNGVFLVDLRTGKTELVVSLQELASLTENAHTQDHYINHVSFAPDGSKFIFFHITGNNGADRFHPALRKAVLARSKIIDIISGNTGSKVSGRAIRLYVYDINARKLSLLEDQRVTSHYCWRNNNELLTTSVKDDVLEYSIYDLSAGTRKVIEHGDLKRDGHPTFFKDGNSFVSDLYVKGCNKQELFAFNIINNRFETLFETDYTVPRSRDKRCDLHPRLWDGGNDVIITIDTTSGEGKCQPDGLRQVAVLKYS